VSLAWRILLLSLLLNVATVGSVQIAVHAAQRQWLASRDAALREAVQGSFAELERVYSAEAMRGAVADGAVVRRLLSAPSLRELYEDVIVTSGRPPYAGVYLNPLGAVHRDPDQFPEALITAGMVEARGVDGILPVAGGYCYALRSERGVEPGDGAAVAGYLWFRPRHAPALPTALPLWTSVVGVAASTLLFGVVLFGVTRRTIRRPLQAIGEAAVAIGQGRYDVQLPERRVPELEPLVATFHSMAARVADQTRTLEAAVRAAVEEAKQKERALVLSSRLASIGTLAAGVAHEINNPIGGMQNAVNRLLQQPDLADKQRVYLQLVQDGLQRIARTAARLLDFAPRRPTPGRFPIARAIEGARALVEHRLQRGGVQFLVDLPAELPAVFGDPHELQQVMLNLLLNSLDALEGRPDGRITVRAEAAGGFVVIHVVDNGPGMAPELLGRVFDPFFTMKDRPDASGLGLFICYSIVRNHGGDIAVDSRPGEGFTARVSLPVAP
jgi:signal transduction histidine kinase